MIESSEAIRTRIDAEWLAEGKALVARERDLDRSRDTLAWEVGDWIAGHPAGYGDMSRLALDLDVPVGTLKNRASVARRIDPSRRRDDLSWSHHAEIAGLPLEEGDAVLKEAALYAWSVDRLRSVLRERSAAGRAERENARLRAEIDALRAEREGPDHARRVVGETRAEIDAALEQIEQGYRRILAAVNSERLTAAMETMHGNARRSVVPGIVARIDRVTQGRIDEVITRTGEALERLTDRHDAGTVQDGMEAGPEAPPAAAAGPGP